MEQVERSVTPKGNKRNLSAEKQTIERVFADAKRKAWNALYATDSQIKMELNLLLRA